MRKMTHFRLQLCHTEKSEDVRTRWFVYLNVTCFESFVFERRMTCGHHTQSGTLVGEQYLATRPNDRENFILML